MGGSNMRAVLKGTIVGAALCLLASSVPEARADEACQSTFMRDFAKCRDTRRQCICRVCPKDPECLCPEGSASNCAQQKKAVYGCRGKASCTQSIARCTETVRGDRARCVQAAADREATRVKSQFRAVPPQGRGFFDYLTKVIQMLRDQKVAFTAEVRRRIANAFSAIFKGQQAFMNAFRLLDPAVILKMEEQRAFRN
jgi:hypothetical protein